MQVGGKHYTRVAGLTWIEKEHPPDSFADVSVGPTELQKDKPTPLPPKVRTAAHRQPQQFDPVGAFIGLVTAPIRFADW